MMTSGAELQWPWVGTRCSRPGWMGQEEFQAGTWSHGMGSSSASHSRMRAEFSRRKIRRGIFMGGSRGSLFIGNFRLPFC